MTELPSIDVIRNTARVCIGPVRLWFSYRTLVAFETPGSGGPVVRKNEWGPTTGKLLNTIDGGAAQDRVPAEDFTRLYRELVEPVVIKPESPA